MTLKTFIQSQDWTDHAIVPINQVQVALKKHAGVFESWIEKGYQAEMDYLERMKQDRFHPTNKLPEVTSVIVLLAWYAGGGTNSGTSCGTNSGFPQPSHNRPTTVPLSGRVARYAAGRDYHKILKKKLIKLSDWLKSEHPNAQTYASVDSGPTVDRVLAEVSGLGFFGKNSMIINPKRGSYFFIASLMTSLELESTPKNQMPNCGNCRKCIVACPTDAIVAPGVIDARRCISYLTIENKEGIPEELRSKIGNRLFGCDICQEVCPFNEGRASRQEVKIDELKSKNGVGESLDLRQLLKIKSDEAFLSQFAGTPLMRAKRRGLLRNACVVAGNSGDSSLIVDLETFIKQEKDDMLKEHARWAIEQLKND